MALPILDGNQSATTLSTILSSGQHITAHTVVSLGTQAITDMRGAVSGSVVSISNLPSTQTIAGTVTANIGSAGRYDNGGDSLRMDLMSVRGQDAALFLREGGGNVPISGTVTANVPFADTFIKANGTGGFGDALENYDEAVQQVCVAVHVKNFSNEVFGTTPFPISGTVTVGNSVTIGSALPTGTNRIGVVTIGAGTVTIGAGTAQIGSVTASISGTVPVSGTFFQATQPVSLTTLPALVASTAQIGSVTASISNSVTIASLPAISGTVTANVPFASTTATYPSQIVAIGYKDEANTGNILAVNNDGDGGLPVFLRNISVEGAQSTQLPSWLNGQESNNVPISGTVTANTFALQGTAVTTSNFTSTTASTLLANYNATREVLTIFNEGAGNLHICAGATCTTIAYQVRLSAGDYYEVPNHQTTITHSAVFATAGTARVTQVS